MDKLRTLGTAYLLCIGLSAHTKEGVLPSVCDPWLYSPNAAALTRYAFDNMGRAELSLTKGKGGFVNFNGSPDVLSVDAEVESFFRLSRRTVVYGAMSYRNFSGDDMAGSAFISSHLPFDIVEDSLTNTGRKHQDTYRLIGGVGYELCNGFSLGARLDYTAANLAKYKDLRHKNKLMDLDLTAGFYMPVSLSSSVSLNLGANYLYHRTTESLQFSTYGKNDKVYNSLISYANFIGHVEQFGNDGYTDKSREMPLVSDYNGVGAQLNLVGSSTRRLVSFYNSFTYAHRRGYYGRRSPYTITYSNHESNLYRYDAQLSFSPHPSRGRDCKSLPAGGGCTVFLDFSLTAENLRNDAANYRELQNEQGATYYEYYTSVKAANKLWRDGYAALTVCLGSLNSKEMEHGCPRPHALHPNIPKWTIRAGLNWHHREQTAYIYPFYRRQDISSREPFVSVCRNVKSKASSPAGEGQGLQIPASRCLRRAYWTFALDFSFLKGSGQPYEDGTFQTPSDKQELPPTMEAYLWREYLWLTAAQYQVGGSVAYSFTFPGTRLLTHVRLSLSHRKANETCEYSNGHDRTTATVAIGCSF